VLLKDLVRVEALRVAQRAGLHGFCGDGGFDVELAVGPLEVVGDAVEEQPDVVRSASVGKTRSGVSVTRATMRSSQRRTSASRDPRSRPAGEGSRADRRGAGGAAARAWPEHAESRAASSGREHPARAPPGV
jgi:hypothetical protein